MGSASRDLIQKSSETLAGRISFVPINTFSRQEIFEKMSLHDYWIKGSYPRSCLKTDLESSFEWRKDYIQSFLERDLPFLGFRVPSVTLKRFWTMLAHSQGQIINYSRLGSSMGVSSQSIKHYIDILEQTFVIRVLKPYFNNTKKRLVKSPKIYIRDTGLLHALLNLESMNDVLGHPVAGPSYETMLIENIMAQYPKHEAFFYRDAKGNEIDLLLVKGQRKIAIEIKLSSSPKVEKGFFNACTFLQPDEKWLIGEVDGSYPGEKGIQVTHIDAFLNLI